MTLEEKAIKLADFWYDTDFYNFKDNFEGIEDAINQAKKCITTDLDRTIEIIIQDISEIEDDEFTKQANEIIKIISNGECDGEEDDNKKNMTLDYLISKFWEATEAHDYKTNPDTFKVFEETIVRQYIKERLPNATDSGCDKLYRKANYWLDYGVEECFEYLDQSIKDIKELI